MADMDYVRLRHGVLGIAALVKAGASCCWCKQPMVKTRPNKRFCSKLCLWRSKDGSTMSREVYRQRSRASAEHRFTCAGCGKDAHRSLGGTARKKGYQNKFCSMACRVALAERVGAESAFLQRLAQATRQRGRPDPRPREFTLGVHYTPPVRTCPCCGLQWSAIRQIGCVQYCQTPGCQAEAHRLKRKRHNAAKGSGSNVGRAKRAGVPYRYFNERRVLERDAWTCQLCGIQTPKDARGSTRPDAPEFDHCIPLAMGGAHTPENGQCLCRACNGAKSDRWCEMSVAAAVARGAPLPDGPIRTGQERVTRRTSLMVTHPRIAAPEVC